MKIALNNFAGMAPKISPSLLPDTFAQKANDVKIQSGELQPFYIDTLVCEVPANTVQCYKYHIPDDANDVGYVWLYFDRKVDIVKDPIFADTHNRIIISGLDGGLRVTDSTLLPLTLQETGEYKDTYTPITLNSSNTYLLGMPVATNIKMAVTKVSNRQNIESRSYVVALVRTWSDGKIDIGKLSNPATTTSGDLVVDVATGETVTLSDITVPSTAGASGVTKAYVYRTTVGSDGITTYGWVGEFNVASTGGTYTFTDSKSSSEVEESAVSSEWDAPIEDLKGIVSLNNGVLAAFSGSNIYFSYPYQTSAWPYTYRVSVDYDIVGLGAFGNTIVVCTKGMPALILVSDPAAATVRNINASFPCLSKETIVNFAGGVAYAAPGGLLWVNSTSPKYVTAAYLTKDEFLDWNPSTLSATSYGSLYIATSKDPIKYHGLMFDIEEPEKGIVSLYRYVKNIYLDTETGDLFLLLPGATDTSKCKIVAYDQKDPKNDRQEYRTYNWRSKIFTSPNGIATLSAARIRIGEDIRVSLITKVYYAARHAVNDVSLNHYDINGPVSMTYIYEKLNSSSYIYFTYFVNGIPRFTKRLNTSDPFRLPSGFRGTTFEVEVESSTPISSIELASSMGELS